MRYSITDTGVNVVTSAGSLSASCDHPNFAEICRALIDKVDVDFDELFDVKKTIEGHGSGFRVVWSSVFFGETKLSDYIASRIIDSVSGGFGTTPVSKFIEKTMQNENPHVHEDLLRWVEHSKLPIDDDGNIIAFKRVAEDFYDIHSHTVKYEVGKHVSIPRSMCTFDRDESCGPGLHFAGRNYWFGTASNPIVMLSIDPRDVTSFPRNEPKGRCCRAFVVKVVSESERDDVTPEGVIAKRDLERETAASVRGSAKPTRIEKRAGRPVAVVRDGRRFLLSQVRTMVSESSQNEVSRELGVPRATLQRWLKL